MHHRVWWKPERTDTGPLPATKEKEGPRRIPLSALTEKDEEKMAGVSSGRRPNGSSTRSAFSP